jgi:hypothetical protein
MWDMAAWLLSHELSTAFPSQAKPTFAGDNFSEATR